MNKLLKHYRSLGGAEKRLGDDRAKMLEKMLLGEIGSAQGLAQAMPESPSALVHADEWVETLRLMAQPNPPPNLAQIRAELLRLTEASGPGRVYRGRKYSKRSMIADSVDVLSASLSILATGTPQQFYNEITSTLLTSGFLPRFTILEYTGGLTRRNPNPINDIEPGLFGRIVSLFDIQYNRSLVLNGEVSDFTDVQPANAEAAQALDWFDNVCYRKVEESNTCGNDMAGIWSRAKEHVRQIACLIAIGVNPYVPTIEAEYVRIAMQIVRPSIDKIERMVTIGEVGTGDVRLEAEIKKLIRRMIDGGWAKFRSYPGVKKELIDNGFFQLTTIRNHCCHLAAFKAHKLGSTNAFELAMNSLMKYGALTLIETNGVKCVKVNLNVF